MTTNMWSGGWVTPTPWTEGSIGVSGSPVDTYNTSPAISMWDRIPRPGTASDILPATTQYVTGRADPFAEAPLLGRVTSQNNIYSGPNPNAALNKAFNDTYGQRQRQENAIGNSGPSGWNGVTQAATYRAFAENYNKSVSNAADNAYFNDFYNNASSSQLATSARYGLETPAARATNTAFGAWTTGDSPSGYGFVKLKADMLGQVSVRTREEKAMGYSPYTDLYNSYVRGEIDDQQLISQTQTEAVINDRASIPTGYSAIRFSDPFLNRSQGKSIQAAGTGISYAPTMGNDDNTSPFFAPTNKPAQFSSTASYLNSSNNSSYNAGGSWAPTPKKNSFDWGAYDQRSASSYGRSVSSRGYSGGFLY